ncbi:arylesterase [Komagataeibacter xylinus E25]|nr:arylesterase [Komagataeibacter xylinus E25]
MSGKNLLERNLLKFYGNDPALLVIDAENLKQIRPEVDKFVAALNDLFREKDIGVESLTVSARGETVRVLLFKPAQEKPDRPAILHIHSGGFVAGSPEPAIGLCQSFAHTLDCVVISVDYRLAPEHPFPAGLEDCYTALKWLHDSAAQLGVNPEKIAITGESGGGGLAAQLAFLVRDRGEISIVLQVLTYPMLDNRTGLTLDPGPNVGEFIWPKDSNLFGWQSYLGDNVRFQTETPPYPAAPTRIGNITGLPPVMIGVGDLDLLARESLLYASQLIEAGVPVELHLYRGVTHGFDVAAGTPAADAFNAARIEAFRRVFAD